MPTVVVTSRFKFGPNPEGQTGAHTYFASLEEPESIAPRDYAPLAPRPEDHRPFDHAPGLHLTGHRHRPRAHETAPVPRTRQRHETDIHHRPHDLTAGHHHGPHAKAPADEFLTKYDRRLTDSPSDKEPAARRVYTPDGEHIPLSGGAASRRDSLSGMKPEFRARLGAMFRDAPPGSSVFSGYRSPALQAQLYNRPHRPGYVARPGHSHHGMGDAADLRGNIGWFHKHAHEYGLRFPMSYENWHIQSDPNTKVPARPPVIPELAPTRKAEK